MPTTTNTIYGNWKMLSPDGVAMCRCSQKRVKWYLDRNLAEIVDDRTFKLKFVPEGYGCIRKGAYYQEERENMCVVCGTTHNLTRHHVIPYRYRKFFPTELKKSNSHDVVVLCESCHHEYEHLAIELDNKLRSQFNCEFYETRLRKQVKILTLANALISEKTIPQDKWQQLYDQVSELIKEQYALECSIELLKVLMNQTYEFSSHKHIVQTIMNSDGIDGLNSFCFEWRQHFVDSMKPMFLSKNWDIFYIHD